MPIVRYQLRNQRGAGSDGVAYAASASDGGPVEVRVLQAARANTERWPAVVKRLRAVSLLAANTTTSSGEHLAGAGAGAPGPAVRQVIELALEEDPPYLVVDEAERSLAEECRGRVPCALAETLRLAEALAGGVAAAHRLGITHGGLSPATIGMNAEQQLKIDFTGLDCGGARTLDDLAAICRAPELAAGSGATPAADVYALGRIIAWLLTGQPSLTIVDKPDDPLRQTAADLGHTTDLAPEPAAALEQLVAAMLAPDPGERPLAPEVAQRLRMLSPSGPRETVTAPAKPGNATLAAPPPKATLAATGEFSRDLAQPTTPVADISTRERLGRFRLLQKVGEGGMGAVYKAEDLTDGTIVAIKVLGAKAAHQATLVRRFHKEARLLAEVNNPYVTNLLEVNEDDGIHYLAMEFVAGQSVAEMLAQRGKLTEPVAAAILADVCRALADAHTHGIVHRDVKPENILVSGGVESGEWLRKPSPAADPAALSTQQSLRIKLSDFGLARHVVESESLNVTRAGAILGTPLYMAPEQCSGAGAIDPRTDVYAMGATLFHLLAGRPPFTGDSPIRVISMHATEPPPKLKKLVPELSEAVCQVVEKCLAKSPDLRYPDAAGLLADLERLLRGEPTTLLAHPRLPECDPGKVLTYDWTWELEASPAQLWPHVSNTERFNRAIGLSAVDWTTQPAGKGRVRRSGKFRKMGMAIAWEEHPFEWIEGRRFGVLREFKDGPWKWFMSQVEMAPRPGGGTTLQHHVRIEPTGLLGRTAAAVEVGLRTKKAIDRVYRRIDAALTGKLGNPALADPFEEPAALSAPQQQRLDELVERLIARGVDANVAEKLGEFLAVAPDQAVARIRPLALAKHLALDADQTVAACLIGAHEGLFVLLWDILCPICRIPSEVKDTLKLVKEHGHCEACNLDYELDFANSVEMIFRAHPAVRACELGIYCIGGPAHSPHVAAQVRVAAKERLGLDLALPEGSYRLRGPQLPFSLDFRVQPGAGTTRWDLDLSTGPRPDLPRTLKPGAQLVMLTNDQEQELVVRVERMAQRADALTAARASALGLFRELFPGEVLSPGQLISVATVTLLVTNLAGAADLYEQWGDTKAFALLHEHFRRLEEHIRREGGALVKTVGEGIMAAFADPVAAARAGLDLQKEGEISAMQSISEPAPTLCSLRIAIHRGAAMAATLNDHLDYFGSTVNAAWRLLERAAGGEIVLSDAVTGDPQVAALLRARNLRGELFPISLPGRAAGVAQRLSH